MRTRTGAAAATLIPTAIRLALALSAVALAACTSQPSGTASLDVSTWRVQTVQSLNLRLRYPPQWHLQSFDEEVGHVGFRGVAVVSIDRDLQHPQYSNGETTGWDMRSMPHDAVSVSIEYVATIFGKSERPDTPMPLSLSDAKPADHRIPAGDGSEVWLPFDLAGRGLVARVWYGPSVAAHDREVASRIVASIAGPIGPTPQASQRSFFSPATAVCPPTRPGTTSRSLSP